MAQPIRVLHIVGAIHPGGMENFIVNLYQNIDRDKLQFDIAVHMRREDDYGELIESLGGRIYVLPRLTKHPFKNLRMLYQLVKTQQYKIVIRHTPNALVAPQLLAAKLAGAQVICHSHNETDPQMLLHILGRCFMGAATDERLACSESAGRWMFGKREFQVIHNAIDVSRFAYDKDKAQSIRNEFGIGQVRVYGNIANFKASKNHLFLLQIYKKLSELDESAVFFCIGDGEERSAIETQIQRLGLTRRVILTGSRHDVDKFMSCMDCLIFPSLFEGLPLTLIEAQAAGLPILVSDTVTKDAQVTQGLMQYASLEQGADEWAVTAQRMAQEQRDRTCQARSIAEHGYDIRMLAVWYQDYLLELARRGIK